MKYYFLPAIFVLLILSCNNNDLQHQKTLPSDGPVQLHPDNPHYFLYRGKALALVTSGEHYGAILNLDFDYKKYLQTLSESGMNYTRIFTGTYFELPGESFGIQNNTLAPFKDRVITPWVKQEADREGGASYDLSQWNEAYFIRLKDFLRFASEKNIIVEVTLFSSIYRDEHWEISPLNPENNISIDHPVNRFDAQTPDNGGLMKYQEAFVRKMVQELNEYDNFFFEIQNEPWSDHAVAVYNIVNKEDLIENDWTYKVDFADERSMAWQEKIASVIVEEESLLKKQHLIAQNYANFRASVPSVDDHISIINFHYAWPDAVEWNYHFNRVIGFDESGFAGSGDQVYRRQAWQFMLTGGALFNNLDYSFYVGKEDGTGVNSAPGGGSKALRQQLRILSEFLHSMVLEKMHPDHTCVLSAPGLIPYVISHKGESYAMFLRANGTKMTSLKLKTGEGKFRISFLNTITGKYSDPLILSAEEGILSMDISIPEGELAVIIRKQ